MTRRQLAELYNIDVATLWRICSKHQKRIDRMATRFRFRGQSVTRKRLNRAQIAFIVRVVMGDAPEGYDMVNGKLIRIDE